MGWGTPSVLSSLDGFEEASALVVLLRRHLYYVIMQ